MLGFKNVNAYVEGKGFIKTDISVENGLIKEIKSGVVDSEISVLIKPLPST